MGSSEMRPIALALAAGLLCLPAPRALAQVQRSGSESARVMQQVQQLTSERNSLKSSNDDLKKQVDDLKQQLVQLGKQKSALQAQLRARSAPPVNTRDQEAARESAAALEKTKGQMQELLGRFRETTATLAGVETQRATLQSQLDVAKRDLNTCVERNIALYQVSTEALDRLDRRSFWSRLGEKEPFTRIQRTRLDNIIDADRERARDLRVEPPKVTPPAHP